MSRRARNRYAEATLASLLLVGIISASGCSEDGMTPKCGAEQPLYNLGDTYRSTDSGTVPDISGSVASRAAAADAGCMTPIGFATSSGGSVSQPTAGAGGRGGAGGTAGSANTAGASGSAGASNGGTSSAGNGGASAGNGGVGEGGLGPAGGAGI